MLIKVAVLNVAKNESITKWIRPVDFLMYIYIYTYIKFIKVSRLTFTTDVVEKVGSFSTIQILLDSFICSFVH